MHAYASFYNRMFKKKANNSKKLDLHQETEQITTRQEPVTLAANIGNQQQEKDMENQQQELISNASNNTIFKKKPKGNLFSLQGLQKIEASGPALTAVNNLSFQEQKVATSEIQMCFNEIRKMKEVELIIQEQDHQHYQQNLPKQKPEKMTIKMEDKNLESQPEVLEIQVDEQGGFSPQLNYGMTEDYDEINGDYEDELIRKTLTKRNYDNLGKYGGYSLNKLKQIQAKDSFIEKLKKVNASSIKKAISRDLHNKRIKLKELNDTLSQLSAYGGDKKSEIEKKQKRSKQLKEQFEKMGKIIEFIYYWGDKINDFSIQGVQKDIAERQKRNNTFSFNNDEEQF